MCVNCGLVTTVLGARSTSGTASMGGEVGWGWSVSLFDHLESIRSPANLKVLRFEGTKRMDDQEA